MKACSTVTKGRAAAKRSKCTRQDFLNFHQNFRVVPPAHSSTCKLVQHSNMQSFHSKQASLLACLEMNLTVYTIVPTKGKKAHAVLKGFFQRKPNDDPAGNMYEQYDRSQRTLKWYLLNIAFHMA